jgi:hypothetical protein
MSSSARLAVVVRSRVLAKDICEPPPLQLRAFEIRRLNDGGFLSSLAYGVNAIRETSRVSSGIVAAKDFDRLKFVQCSIDKTWHEVRFRVVLSEVAGDRANVFRFDSGDLGALAMGRVRDFRSQRSFTSTPCVYSNLNIALNYSAKQVLLHFQT